MIPSPTLSLVASLCIQNDTQDRMTIKITGMYIWKQRQPFHATVSLSDILYSTCIRKYPVCRLRLNLTCSAEKSPSRLFNVKFSWVKEIKSNWLENEQFVSCQNSLKTHFSCTSMPCRCQNSQTHYCTTHTPPPYLCTHLWKKGMQKSIFNYSWES